jgi:hypothetical protein
MMKFGMRKKKCSKKFTLTSKNSKMALNDEIDKMTPPPASQKSPSPSHGLCLQRKLNAIPLVLIQIAVLVLLLALILERNNDETHEYVHHEEGNDDDVHDVVGGHNRPEVVNGAHVFGIRVDRDVEQAGPALECRHREERQHGLGHVVKVKAVVVPLAVLHVGVIGVLANDEVRAVALVGRSLRAIRAAVEFSLVWFWVR